MAERVIKRPDFRTDLALTCLAAALPIALVVALPGQFDRVVAPDGYLVFHNVSEFFSIMVSLSIFGVGWFTYEQSRDRHSLMLSAAFLAIGLLDFMHVLSNAAMPPFITPNSSNKSTQFWVAARLFQGAAFLCCAAAYSGKFGARLSGKALLAVAFLVPGLAFAGIVYHPELVPDTYLKGVGLTSFKKSAEFLSMGLLCAALAWYRRLRLRTKDRALAYYQAALAVSIFGELNFAVYTRVFDSFNILGHVYKVAAFILIYKGIFVASVREPYRRLAEVSVSRDELSREVQERQKAEDELHRAHDELARLVEERTRQLGEKEVLLKEIHHRVKNNLQIVSSLVSLQADGLQDEAVRTMLGDVTDRVRSMALVHEKLYQSADLSRIDFDEYCKSLLNYLWRAHGNTTATIRLTLDLDPVALPVDVAIPLGLILNELAGNALKHAFAGRAEGEVTVELKGVGTGLVRLRVRDDGAGLPEGLDWRRARSMGLYLVQLLGGQLGAEIDARRDEGTEFVILLRTGDQ